MSIIKPCLLFYILCILFSCEHNLSCKDLNKNFFFISSNLKTTEDSAEFIRKLNDLIKKEPYCLKSLQLRGYFQIAKGNYLDSKKDFLEVIKADSSDVYSLYYLGMLYNFEGKNEKSLVFLNRAKKIKEAKGYIIDSNNDFADRLDVKYTEINHFRGIVFFEEHDYAEAKSLFLYCLKKNYYGYDTFGYLAAIYSSEKNTDSACFFYHKAIEGGEGNVYDSSLVLKCR